MALNFDYSKVKDSDRLFEYRTSEPEQTNFIIGSNWWQEDDGRWCRYQPWFDSLLMTAMILMPAPGWGITEKNVEKFIDRLMMYQAVNGPLLIASDAEGKATGLFVTPEQVRSLVGLKVNVATVPENTFRKTLMHGVEHLASNLRVKIEKEMVPV